MNQSITTKCICHVDVMLPFFVPILKPPTYSCGDEIVKLHLKKVEKVLLLLQGILCYSFSSASRIVTGIVPLPINSAMVSGLIC